MPDPRIGRTIESVPVKVQHDVPHRDDVQDSHKHTEQPNLSFVEATVPRTNVSEVHTRRSHRTDDIAERDLLFPEARKPIAKDQSDRDLASDFVYLYTAQPLDVSVLLSLLYFLQLRSHRLLVETCPRRFAKNTTPRRSNKDISSLLNMVPLTCEFQTLLSDS